MIVREIYGVTVSEIGAAALGNQPPFGPNGEWPALESSPVEIVRTRFLAQSTPELYGAGASVQGWDSYLEHILDLEPEIREAVYSQAWRREDPIVQLPPGASSEISLSTTYGVSETQARELSRSLGLQLGAPMLQLTAELSSKFGIETNLTEQQTITETMTLQNSGSSGNRLFALWFIKHTIAVHHWGLVRTNRRVPRELSWAEARRRYPKSKKAAELARSSAFCTLSFRLSSRTTNLTGWPS